MAHSNDFLHASTSFAGYNYPAGEADVIFMGIPFSSTSISGSSSCGPAVMRHALRLVEGFDPATGKDVFCSKICDIGDIEVVPGSYELTSERIIDTVKQARDINKNAVFCIVGGEHLITLPVASALRPKTIIHFDAHMDLRSDYLGNKFSHTTWAYHAISSLGCKIFQIGVREFCEQEIETAKKFNVVGVQSPEQLEEMLEKSEGPYYITVDMDVFDPCYVETGLPVSCGLSPGQVFEFIEKMKGRNITGFDINEISSRELGSKTGFLAAEIFRKILSVL